MRRGGIGDLWIGSATKEILLFEASTCAALRNCFCSLRKGALHRVDAPAPRVVCFSITPLFLSRTVQLQLHAFVFL